MELEDKVDRRGKKLPGGVDFRQFNAEQVSLSFSFPKYFIRNF